VDDNARAFSRNMFRLKVHESDGQTFEDLFVKIMGQANPKFRPVKAHGNIGDRKNDGFDKSTGTYYQVYAPEDIRKTQGDALKKLKADFKGLKAFWHGIYPVKRYFFVINDKYAGVSPAIGKELAKVQKKHKIEECDALLAKHLEHALFQLADDVIISIIGHVPAINPNEFLFLSGFTYFLGAWIEFEKKARSILESPNVHPYLVTEIIRVFREQNVIDREDAVTIDLLRKQRNRIVHGDSKDIPEKRHIDRLVAITERLQQSRGNG
jgi:hypothetical protein